MEGQDVELILTEQESVFMPLYQRLPGDAMDPVLDDATPPTIYEQGSWGPEEADGLIGRRPMAQSQAASAAPMATMHDLVFLFDVDNTLLDNDRQARKPAVQIALECIDTITSRRQEMSVNGLRRQRIGHGNRNV
jgi:hypothetical protein